LFVYIVQQFVFVYQILCILANCDFFAHYEELTLVFNIFISLLLNSIRHWVRHQRYSTNRDPPIPWGAGDIHLYFNQHYGSALL